MSWQAGDLPRIQPSRLLLAAPPSLRIESVGRQSFLAVDRKIFMCSSQQPRGRSKLVAHARIASPFGAGLQANVLGYFHIGQSPRPPDKGPTEA